MKLRLYHKTFLITFITTLLTLASFTLIFQMFASSFLSTLEDNQFNSALKELSKIKDFHDLSAQNINSIEIRNQTSIRISSASGFMYYPQVIINPNKDNQSFEESDVISFEFDEIEGSKSATVELNFNGNKYYAVLTHNGALRAQDVKQLFMNMIPILAILGVLISLIVSYVYAKYMLVKINRMNDTMLLMSDLNYPVKDTLNSGDELNELENHINELYRKLIHEMDVIKRFEKDRDIFMRGTIHELKTPIMIIELQLRDMLEAGFGSESEEARILQIQTQLMGMRALVNGGLELSKIDVIKKNSKTDIERVIHESLDYYAYMIEDRHLKLEIETEPTIVAMHPSHLSHIIANLLSNAIRYCDEKGSIIISQNSTHFEISNSFSGSIANIDEITKPFVRGNNSNDNEGHGLGLYLLCTIISNYGLEYHFRLENNTFTFTFNL